MWKRSQNQKYQMIDNDPKEANRIANAQHKYTHASRAAERLCTQSKYIRAYVHMQSQHSIYAIDHPFIIISNNSKVFSSSFIHKISLFTLQHFRDNHPVEWTLDRRIVAPGFRLLHFAPDECQTQLTRTRKQPIHARTSYTCRTVYKYYR